MPLKKAFSYFPFVLGLIAGLYFISFKVVGTSLTFFPGDYIDGRFNNYLLEHAYQYFTGKTGHYWNAPFMFPEENVITYSDNLLGSAPFYMMFRLFGADRETSFQLWYLIVTILNYSCCFLLLRYLFKNNYAAACGAMVFAFSMALHSQMGHAQTFPRFAAPLALWMLLKYLEELNPKYFFMSVLMLVYQMYCGIYLGFLLTVTFGVLFVLIVIAKWKEHAALLKQKRWIKNMLLGALINIVLLLPLLIPYHDRAAKMGLHDYSQIVESLPTFASYFFSWRGSLWWDCLGEVCISYPAFWNHEIFAGGFALLGFLLVVLLFAIGAFYKPIYTRLNIDTNLKLVLLTGIITMLLFIRVNDLSPYRIIYFLPGFGSMRALQRIINIELIFFGAALACLVNLITRRQNGLSTLVTVVLIACIVADNYVKEGFIHQKVKFESRQRINAVYDKMKNITKDCVVSYEPDTLTSMPMDYQLDAMLASQSLGLTTMNGYSSTSPGGYGPYWEKPCEVTRKAWLERKEMPDFKVAVIK